MIRKSAWLLSAGLVAVATPAFGQTAVSNTDTDKQAAKPTPGAAEGAATQDQARQQQSIDTSDIVITATRRNEALSDVPMAVSAVTAQALQYTGATDIRQLNQVAPSLLVSSTSSEAGAAVARIRGVGTVGDNPGLESSVGLFIDGVYRARTGIGLTDLGPLDRIEVLRGPQGTLFGRNTSAGLISIITAKPRFTPEASGQVDIGNYSFKRLQGSVTGPVSDAVALRLDGVWDKRDGFLKDVISGRRVNDRNRWMLRGQALFQPNDNLSFRLIADYSKQNEECCAAPYLPAHDTVSNGSGGVTELPSSIAALERSLGAVIEDDPFARKVSITPGRSYRSDVKDGGVSGELVYDFGGAELTSLTAYRFNKYIGGQDADFNNLDILYRDDNGGLENKFNTFSQELRLQGNTWNNRLDWLVGVYFADEKLTRKDNLSVGNDADLYFGSLVRASSPLLAGFPGFNLLNPFAQGFVAQQLLGIPQVPVGFRPFVINAIASQVVNTPLSNQTTQDVFTQKGKNYAIFTHNIFKITDQLSLTLGARYTIDKKHLSADLNSTSVCAAYLGNILRLQQLAAAAAQNPLGNGGLNQAIGPLAAALANQVLTPLAQAPCILNSVNGSFGGGRNKEDKLSGTAVLSYKPFDRLLTYASYSRGYKGGGFNLDRAGLNQNAPDLNDLRFRPEINNAFEIGAKYNGRGIDVNLAIFHEAFRDFQLNTFNGINFVVENINSCSHSLNGADTDSDSATGACDGKLRSGVVSQGFELEAFTRPIRNVQWNAGLVMADTKYRHNLVGAEGVPLTNALFQLPGRRISNAPKWTGTTSIAWTPPIGGSGIRGLIYADARYMSKFNTGSDLDIEKTQKGFALFNGRIGIHGPDDSWGVEFWGQNLFDKHYIQVGFDAPVQGSGTTRAVEAGFIPAATQLYGAFLGEPRTFGLTLRAKTGFARPAPVPYVAPPAPPPPPPVVEQPAPPPPPPPPAPTERGERG
ncbi:MAG TPA: TonB-dependent receptor [Sphingomicrobium sp.]|nr:TonB-dependent receptor [Sphingomicrobium sp.]